MSTVIRKRRLPSWLISTLEPSSKKQQSHASRGATKVKVIVSANVDDNKNEPASPVESRTSKGAIKAKVIDFANVDDSKNELGVAVESRASRGATKKVMVNDSANLDDSKIDLGLAVEFRASRGKAKVNDSANVDDSKNVRVPNGLRLAVESRANCSNVLSDDRELGASIQGNPCREKSVKSEPGTQRDGHYRDENGECNVNVKREKEEGRYPSSSSRENRRASSSAVLRDSKRSSSGRPQLQTNVKLEPENRFDDALLANRAYSPLAYEESLNDVALEVKDDSPSANDGSLNDVALAIEAVKAISNNEEPEHLTERNTQSIYVRPKALYSSADDSKEREEREASFVQDENQVDLPSLHHKTLQFQRIKKDDSDELMAIGKAQSLEPMVRQFSELLERVVFSISGLVNPERGDVRKMALDMGADYRPSWSSDCTLLIAALANTPSFNQVKAAGGTIVHKDWIVECYKQKRLIPIEKYMMHIGNPWRSGDNTEKDLRVGIREGKFDTHTAMEDANKGPATKEEIEKLFSEDLNSMRSWLDGQPEKPQQEMLLATAAQGLVACLDDGIESLKADKGLKLVLDSWAFIPKAIMELQKESRGVSSKEISVREAERIRSIYLKEIEKMDLHTPQNENAESDDDATDVMSDSDSRDIDDCNSDDTEELDEDEITECQIKILRSLSLH